jgi:AraC family transcriptional regulator
MDIAQKYGYDSPDNFTRAFTRFHEVTPTAVRKDGAMIKLFAPLKIKFALEGGYLMGYKIVEKDSVCTRGSFLPAGAPCRKPSKM